MTMQMPGPDALADVHVGMPVFDSEDRQLGAVAAVKFGDPQAITAEGQQGHRGFGEVIRDAVTGPEPDVPPQLAEKLLRTGYLKIDGKGLFATDLYAGADQVDRVEDDTVRLTVPRDLLVPEM